MIDSTMMLYIGPKMAKFLGTGYTKSCTGIVSMLMDEKSTLDIFSYELPLRMKSPTGEESIIAHVYINMITGEAYLFEEHEDTMDHKVFVASLN